jgi:hypothetical protein
MAVAVMAAAAVAAAAVVAAEPESIMFNFAWLPWKRRYDPPVDDPSTYKIAPQSALLWAKLQSFVFDKPGADEPFSKRLAYEQKWSHDYALRVVNEYRKFIFLCMTAGHMCTPSINVDMAWHLHLLYTRSYWDELCTQVLGKPLHHQPSDGGTSEEGKYAGLYEQTLDSYARVFGEPPADIWGRRKRP